ncbi:S66 family peptidase [Krasilnikoviella flava]|uniref:Muramoyltetrapeptide carboxypeptidase LdcA (Peptidoglycan recycling) n=1 Tax=Krasilnikoviella flava TaxID=526729 RepID=A0A1T5K7J8_9MICO|nr:S66 peptidase family protein [Krasilnikoviella flava]SKC59666.1 Muramoyltetrapeptide carboxypeptidase LdcA (peptidoglycan recycling) [Krasilnikoviella flava]
MTIRYPRPLRPGDTIGVTAPSAGVAPPLHRRLHHAADVVRAKGYDVRVGETPFADGVVAGPAEVRAAELTAMLTDPAVRAVVPPWGGELATDLLGRLDWDALAADPTWLVGFSDVSTLQLPLTLRTGVATLHGQNLMDSPYDVPDGLLGWWDVASAPQQGEELVQRSPRRYRSSGWDDYENEPEVSTWTLDAEGSWLRLDGGDAEAPLDVRGRLIGGCLETVSLLAGTPYGDVRRFASEHAPEGLVVYLDILEWEALEVGRALWGMRHAGWFDAAHAVLLSRTPAPDSDGFTQHDAVRDALGDLGIPLLADVECGHVPPYLALVNGALARVQHAPAASTISQRLVP